MARYTQVYDGEWVQPKRKGYRMACCDCGLVHVLNFALVKYGGNKRKIVFQATRDKRATAARRKRSKK